MSSTEWTFSKWITLVDSSTPDITYSGPPLGYGVDLAGAEPYTLPPPSAPAVSAASVHTL